MKTGKPRGFHTPFATLEGLLKKPAENRKKNLPVTPATPREHKAVESAGTGKEPQEDDHSLFARYTNDVRPLGNADDLPVRAPGPINPPPVQEDADTASLALLKELIEGGSGFVVSHTGEYVEGTGYGIHPGVAGRLHAGEFSVQAHVDLHGMLVEEAEEALDEFIERSLALGRRAVLVVHGRGRSSRNEPVLKNRMIFRLTKGPWRKWVIAFASARSCDGGAGATYVLFRDRPITHKAKKTA
jgi:DNA-nicking Smr family endonuclease